MKTSELHMVGTPRWFETPMIALASWLFYHSKKWELKVVPSEGTGII